MLKNLLSIPKNQQDKKCHGSRNAANKFAGFTIVELLIVIVVIGVLASITASAYSGVTQKARFTSYVNDINMLRKAVLLYQADHGYYPYSGASSGYITWSTSSPTIPGLSPDYIKTIPIPSYTTDGTYYAYGWTAGGANYKLMRLEPVGKTLPSVELNGPMKIDPVRGNRAWAIWSDGGVGL
jgi:prepilin-type N-terminal cleavage/methylation domain-containing protein